MTVLTENRVFTLLTELASCLCAQIADPANGVTGVCYCGLMPGDAVPMDYADGCTEATCGMAAVRLVTSYPATTIGQPNESPGNCMSQLGVDIEMGIWRCAPMIDDSGNLPTPAEMLTSTQDQVADMFVLHRAVQCCALLPASDYRLGPYLPIGPQGGVYGGTITVQVAL